MYQAFLSHRVAACSNGTNIPNANNHETSRYVMLSYTPFAGSMFSSAPPGSLANSEPLPPTSVTPPTILCVFCASPVLILV